ncbi:nucleoside-diphosphate-sugar epimerase [Streptomyces sp. B3I7]|uniref:NAD(P)-dependent oxidoreductase n=1 Tax=Streptomyces sp. B3I7 TaxID=3042269 RepID=UPI00278A9854|nr:NAD(P)H-binding protein [Streptomyces sp. B3I7]MDQ0808309.1 nucleoside-diphosphate-sugar epimerase [Streptomyces sp. B3I7]
MSASLIRPVFCLKQVEAQENDVRPFGRLSYTRAAPPHFGLTPPASSFTREALVPAKKGLDIKMRIAVFGSTGPTGKVFLDAAAQYGHRTTAHVRDPSRLRDASADRVVVGEVFDEDVVCDTLTQADAALIAFGLKGNRTTALYSRGTELIISVMRRLEVPRLVVISEASYDSHVRGVLNRGITLLYGITQRPIIRERRAQDAAVASSGLHWTIMRPTILTDGPASARQYFYEGPRNSFLPRLSRRNLSHFICDSLEDSSTYSSNIYM